MGLVGYSSTGIFTDVKASIDQENSDQIADQTYYNWINTEYQRFRLRASEVDPELYAAFSDFTISSGNTVSTVIAINVYFVKPLALYYLDSGIYVPLKIAEQGQAFKSVNNVNGSYRCYYVGGASSVASSGQTLLLPFGIDQYLVQRVAVRARMRLEENPDEDRKLAEEIYQDFVSTHARQYLSTPRAIADVDFGGGWTGNRGGSFRWRVHGTTLEVFE